MHRFQLKAEYLLKKDINELYIMSAIRTFAISTIMIFIPIFLLKNNFSFIEIGLYIVFCYLTSMFTCYLALKLASKKGVKHCIIVSVPTTILFFLMLYNLVTINLAIGNFWTLLVLGITHSLAGSFYWMGFHLEFSKFSDVKKSAKQVGITNVVSTVFSILGPLFGAIIITTYSFNALFIIVMILMGVSFVPLLFSREYHEPFSFDFKEVLSKSKDHKNWPFIAEGIRDMSARIYWPVLLYILAISLNQIGGIYAISNTGLVLVTLYLGKIINKKNKRKILTVGAFLNSTTLIIRTLFKTIAIIAIVQGAGGLTWAMVHIPFSSTYYNNCKKKGIGYSVYFRELYLDMGRVIGSLILIILLLIVEPKLALIITIIIGAFAGLVMTKIKDE